MTKLNQKSTAKTTKAAESSESTQDARPKKNVSYQKEDRVYQIKRPRLASTNAGRAFLPFFIVLFLLSTFCGSLFLSGAFVFGGERQTIDYTESASTDYKVYLKPNNFYSEKFLGRDMQYVADIINTINVKFNYDVKSSESLDHETKTKIVGTIRITDRDDDKKVLFTKDYQIKPESTESRTTDDLTIHKEIDIDYDKYNSYANDFRKTYSLATAAALDVRFIVQNDGSSDQTDDFMAASHEFTVTIPLSEQTIGITSNPDNFQYSGELDLGGGFREQNLSLLIAGIVLILISITMFAFILYIITVHTNDIYHRALRKILKEYDTNIVTATSDFIEAKDTLRVSTFAELLDAQQIENAPILFYEVEPENKAYFVVRGAKATYRFTLSRAYQLQLKREGKKDEF